eukprot:TRINITY_DN22575_c0_g1_i1.p1 TRINITY_DN22575_c0_g1~~TRINITY_DN22575_c0_g1_i1.p1  ORF type:complete len:217 (-),score=52.28 TRINITY_DN22575_c0_g1_i1:253-903(-)
MAMAAPVSLSLPPSSVAVAFSGRQAASRRAGLAVRCQHREQCAEEAGVSRRDVVAGGAAGLSLFVSLTAGPAFSILEADEDDTLLEKVKADRQKKIKKRVEIKSGFQKETESVQAAVYELSKVGQALDGSDFAAADSVLSSRDKGWIADVETALSKVSSSPEEEGEAQNFTSALAQLQSAVSKQDPDDSKKAFFVSASALERWSTLTGLSNQLKGL